MKKLASWYLNLKERDRTLFILGMFSLFIFLCLVPLFFFYEIQGYSYPLGWILGSIFSLLAYYSIDYQSKALGNNGKMSLVLLLNGARTLGYLLILLLGAICTFKKEWFGGFDAFSFYTSAASLIPMPFILLILSFSKKKEAKVHKSEEIE